MKRKYFIVSYKLREGQTPQVEIPSRCLWRGADNRRCDVKHCRFRNRKTGPCHPLVVVKCHHGPAFTLYPPGYGPYKRTPVAPMSAAGEVVLVGGRGDADKKVSEPAWQKTLFAAVLDAFRGESWSRESPAHDLRRRRTQRRHIALSAMLVGLAVELDEAIAQRIADCLGIAYLMLSDLRSAYRTALTYQGKGAAIVSALELIPVDRTLGDRLLQAGFIGGLWGRPERWDPG